MELEQTQKQYEMQPLY